MKTILVLSVLVLSACASTESQVKTESVGSVPAWVNQPQAAYPANRYLVSVGNGRDRNSAISDAKKQMAESFVVKVKSEIQTKASSTLNQNTAGSVSGEAKEVVSKDLSLTSETSLRGAEVKEVAQLESEFYALVALDKLTARSGLVMESNRIKQKLESTLEALEDTYTKQKMNEAKAEMSNLDQLYGEAAALGMSALIEVNPLRARVNKIENAARSKNSKSNFAVKMVKGADYFEHDVQACINDRGGVAYTYDQAPSDAHKIQITVLERPQHMTVEGWNKIRFDLSAAVVQSNGKMFRVQATQTETGRNREAVLESVSEKLSRDFCEGLFNRMNEVR
jgi:hypothetical protein